MTSFIAAGGSGRSTSLIPAVPAASSVTTIAFIRRLLVSSPRLHGIFGSTAFAAQTSASVALRRRGDRVGALCLVAVLGGEVDVGPAPRSVPRIALLFPGVTVVVVAVGLPEAGLVVVAQLEAADPLRVLPEVEMRDQQPGRTPVLGLERLAPVLVGDPCPATGQILERQVGRIAAVTPRGDVAGVGVDAFEQCVDRDPGPGGVELRPLGDAMDVGGDRFPRQRDELLPWPRHRLIHG